MLGTPRTVVRATLGCLLLALLGSCSQPRYSRPLDLIQGIGAQIVKVSTGPGRRARSVVLAHLPDHLDVDVLSRVDADRLLVSTYPRHRIYLLDTATKRWQFLRKGWDAVYFPLTKSFVFLDNPEGGFSAQELWLAPLDAPSRAKLLDHGPFPIEMPIVPIAANAFVYSSWRKTGTQRVWLYNITLNTYVPLHIKGVYPELWLPEKRLLLCVNLAKLDRPYTLRDLGGHVVQRLPLGNWYTPSLVLPSGREILFGKQSGGGIGAAFRHDDLVVYSLQTGKLHRVLGHTFVGLDTVLLSGPKP